MFSKITFLKSVGSTVECAIRLTLISKSAKARGDYQYHSNTSTVYNHLIGQLLESLCLLPVGSDWILAFTVSLDENSGNTNWILN